VGEFFTAKAQFPAVFELLNLSGSYSPKLASIREKLPTTRYPAACCGEVHYFLRTISQCHPHPEKYHPFDLKTFARFKML
jgi:hypothetical protein